MAMSSSESASQSTRLSSVEMEHTSRVTGVDTVQQLKWRERQRFFEEVFQHDVDVYLSAAHLHIEHRRPPVGSISSMEVNVDMLEQMDLLDISDQEALDVFLNSGVEDGVLDSPLSVSEEDDDEEEMYKDQILLEVPHSRRMSSTSSGSTDPYSLDTSEEGVETPVVQSDDEEGQGATHVQKANPQAKEGD